MAKITITTTTGAKPENVQGFQSKRLVQARTVAHLKQRELAEESGISAQMISLYERGKAIPPDKVVTALASYLKSPVEFFYKPLPASGDTPVFFRSMAAATKQDRDSAAVKLNWIGECISYFEGRITIPEYGFVADAPAKFVDTRPQDIESCAQQLRRTWGLGDAPIPNLANVAEANGIFYFTIPLGNTSLDGLSSHRDGKHPCIVVGTEKQSACRRRFDLAHEIGHIVLHGNVTMEEFAVAANRKLIEKQAHRFASALLLPEDAFIQSLIDAAGGTSISLETIRDIKPYWRVSIAAMVRRLKDLDQMDDAIYKRLNIAISRRGWRHKEPFDDELECEQAHLLRWCLNESRRGRVLGDNEFERTVSLPRSFLAEII